MKYKPESTFNRRMENEARNSRKNYMCREWIEEHG